MSASESVGIDEKRKQVFRRVGLVATGAVLAVVVRVAMFDHESTDYKFFVKGWYEFISTHGGFGALKYSFADYNVPYLYLIAALTYLPIPALIGVKIISVVFDLVLAYFTYRVVALRHTGRRLPALAALSVLFLPTVATNSGMWGQADSLYAAFGLGGVYFLLRRRPWPAGLFFGLSLAFKLQAVFLFPLLLVLAWRRWIPWRVLLAVPGVVLLLDVPALLVGAPIGRLLSVYAEQTSAYPALSMLAPSIYQFLPASADAEVIRPIGIAVTGLVILGLCLGVWLSRARLTTANVVLMGAAAAVLVPFLLPSMHERYFYLAEVLTVIAAFYLPRRLWYVPVLVQVASFLAYRHVLFPAADSTPPGDLPGGPGLPVSDGQATPGDMSGGMPGGMSSQYAPTLEFRILAALMAVAVVSVVWTALREFRRDSPPEAQKTQIHDALSTR
ncbi:glycosyltransferase 87 family protein [Streptomyces sp. NBC_00286]|uniref:glycosyltransferase 87 family protein n=1 Tax=Streptomyces sp. NBC_00286 TaxID=2975701 RepID=UPI002E2D51E2|nr:glycosyltransferase 87 family protein [Streptomyces sp. NBC_00286]